MSRRRRALHLVEVGIQWPPETFVCLKLEGLAARGMRVTVASNVVVDEEAKLRGVELLHPPRSGSAVSAWRAGLVLALTSPRRLVRLIRNVRRVPAGLAGRHGGARGLLQMCLPLARLRPDIVQFEWNIAAVDHLPLFGVWRCPVVTSCRGSDVTVYPHVPYLRAYADHLPEVMRQASAVHCVSESLMHEARSFDLDPVKARVITPAVDHRAFRPSWVNGGPPGDHLRVVMVGRLRWEKGCEYALQAIRRVIDAGVPAELELVGDSPSSVPTDADEGARITHTVADLALERHVILRGGVTPDEVKRRLAHADVLLHASVAEGIPNVVLEAMACAVPVVATDVGGTSEAVRNGVEGILVAPRDPAGLAEALLLLARDPALRARMGAAGRARVEERFTLDAQLQDFLTMYREVAA